MEMKRTMMARLEKKRMSKKKAAPMEKHDEDAEEEEEGEEEDEDEDEVKTRERDKLE